MGANSRFEFRTYSEGVVTFENIQEILSWVEIQHKSFAELRTNLIHAGVNVPEVLNSVVKLLSIILGKCDRVNLLTYTEEEDAIWDEMTDQIFDLFDVSRGSLVTSKDRTFKEIFKLIEDGNFGHAERVMKETFEPWASIVSKLLSKELEGEDDNATTFSEQAENYRALAEDFAKIRDELKLSEKQRAEQEQKNKELLDKIDNVQQEYESVENIQSAYEEKVSLDEAHSYWRNKAVAHAFRFKGYAIVLFIWVIVGFVFLYSELGGYRSDVRNADNIYDILPFIPLNALLILFFIWGSRIFLKLVFSENHLANRASEKATLIMTYLGLVKEGDIKAEDRAVFLEPVFSLSQDGVVQDDGMPKTGPIELLTKTQSSNG